MPFSNFYLVICCTRKLEDDIILLSIIEKFCTPLKGTICLVQKHHCLLLGEIYRENNIAMEHSIAYTYLNHKIMRDLIFMK